jgi:hypothetical protein
MFTGCPGRLFSPDPHSDDWAKGSLHSLIQDLTAIDSKGFQRLRTVVDAYASQEYSLLGYNCAVFAVDAWNAATGDSREFPPEILWTSPADISDDIKKHLKARKAPVSSPPPGSGPAPVGGNREL